MERQRVFIVDTVRTPMGAPMGSLERFISSDLAAMAIKSILERNNLNPLAVDQVIFGQSLPSTMPNNIGHYAWLKAELPVEVPGYTVQMNAASALQAVRNAYYLVAAGDDGVVMVGGADSYSAAPFVMRDVRRRFQPENRIVIDSLEEAECCTQPQPMSRMAQYEITYGKGIGRNAQMFAEESRQKAAAFRASCESGVVPMAYMERKKGEVVIREDEWLNRPHEGPLAPNADCAAVMLLASEENIAALNLTATAEILGFAVSGCAPVRQERAGTLAVEKLLAAAAVEKDDISQYEIAENCASDVLAIAESLGVPTEKINPFGGAIAFGKCDGAEGILMLQRMTVALAPGELGVICSYSAGGMGMACLIKKT